MRIRDNLDFLGVIALSVIVAVTSFSGLETPLTRLLFGLPFLLASGYAVYTAISYFQQPLHAQPTPLFERALYTIAYTLALVVLGGIVLNNTSAGIRRESWTLFLAILAIGASFFGLVRRQNVFGFAISIAPRRVFSALAYVGTIMLALALSLVGDQTRPTDGFTMFWTLPDRDHANLLDIGVNSEEHTAQTYHISLVVDGAPFGNYPSIQLAPGAEWSLSLSLPPGVTTVEARLFRSSDTTIPYRTTHLEWGALQQLETQP